MLQRTFFQSYSDSEIQDNILDHPIISASVLEWGTFILGSMVGISLALPSNYVFEYLQLFNPCESFRSTLLLGAYLFYVHMVDFIDM